jgi:hypothetical protein
MYISEDWLNRHVHEAVFTGAPMQNINNQAKNVVGKTKDYGLRGVVLARQKVAARQAYQKRLAGALGQLDIRKAEDIARAKTIGDPSTRQEMLARIREKYRKMKDSTRVTMSRRKPTPETGSTTGYPSPII